VKKISPRCYIYKTEIPETDWEKTPLLCQSTDGGDEADDRRMGKSKGGVRSETAGTTRKTESDIQELIITTTLDM
jgi:hypothetical protein